MAGNEVIVASHTPQPEGLPADLLAKFNSDLLIGSCRRTLGIVIPTAVVYALTESSPAISRLGANSTIWDRLPAGLQDKGDTYIFRTQEEWEWDPEMTRRAGQLIVKLTDAERESIAKDMHTKQFAPYMPRFYQLS